MVVTFGQHGMLGACCIQSSVIIFILWNTHKVEITHVFCPWAGFPLYYRLISTDNFRVLLSPKGYIFWGTVKERKTARELLVATISYPVNISIRTTAVYKFFLTEQRGKPAA
jgi:hypothetical protein